MIEQIDGCTEILIHADRRFVRYAIACDQLAHSEYGSTHLQFVSAVIEHDSFGHSNAGQKWYVKNTIET